ncbi:MAG: phenylacetate--CoA ligase [Rikenellaceae bacterium]
MIWNSSKECMSRDEMHELQGKRLHKTVHNVYHKVPFYRNKMQAMDVTPDDIRTVEDIVKLPFTTKNDLRDNYPYGLFGVPMSEIIRIHASSGTTGLPTVVGYTRKDISVWSELMARCMTAYGTSSKDIFSVAYGYGLFTGGLGAHYGVEALGGTVIPTSTGNTQKHIQLLRDFGATALAATPSFMLYLADSIEKMGLSPKDDISLKTMMLGAEPWTEAMRQEIEERFGVNAYNLYGLSEIMGPGVSHECQFKCGSHIAEDHFLPEIISPDTLEQLPYGEQGELVFTTITKEGIPLLRYRTKDLCSLIAEPCECGRTNVRMTRIVGRSDDMLIIKGVNVFPSQIEEVVLGIEELEPHYMIYLDRLNNQDTFEVQVEVRPAFMSDNMSKMLQIKKKVASKLHSMLGLNPEIKLVEPKTLQRFEGKSKRVVDNRKL